MGTLGPIMDIGASEHWGKMGIWGKCTPGKMSTIRANQQLGQIWAIGVKEQFGQMSVWNKWACGNWDKWMFGA